MPLITELYAFIATEEPGEEGVPAISSGPWMMPLFGADQARVDSLRNHAQLIADSTGRVLTLARFSIREDIEQITPQGRVGQHGGH